MDWALAASSTKTSTSQRTLSTVQIKVNNWKSIDLVMRIELTRAILMTRFSNFLINSTIQFRMFLYLLMWWDANPILKCFRHRKGVLFMTRPGVRYRYAYRSLRGQRGDRVSGFWESVLRAVCWEFSEFCSELEFALGLKPRLCV